MATRDVLTFTAPEYQVDGSIRSTLYAFAGSSEEGWEVRRGNQPHLRLGPGYQLLQTSHCGVCATDLARRHLPFPLPQVTGHEAVARDGSGSPVVVEINASHAACGVEGQARCAFCRSNLGIHCPERLVLGIHDLPGGFSPWLLAPVNNVVAVPPVISPVTAALVEPFAAALHAVRAVGPKDGERVAVLGPRRLGSLVIAALAAWRAHTGCRYEILAVARRPELLRLARALGADEVLDAGTAGKLRDLADVVVETTGSPEGLALAAQLATREVHVKSTTGRPTLGLSHLTELVVDEILLAPMFLGNGPGSRAFEDEGFELLSHTLLPSPPVRVAAVLGAGVPGAVTRALEAHGLRVLAGDAPAEIAALLARDPDVPLGGVDLAVVTSLAAVDAAIRPVAGVEQGLVRARGTILVVDVGQPRNDLLEPLLAKGLRVSTSRCGDFRAAIELLASPTGNLGRQLGERMVTDVLPAERLADAFTAASGPNSIKVLATHSQSQL